MTDDDGPTAFLTTPTATQPQRFVITADATRPGVLHPDGAWLLAERPVEVRR